MPPPLPLTTIETGYKKIHIYIFKTILKYIQFFPFITSFAKNCRNNEDDTVAFSDDITAEKFNAFQPATRRAGEELIAATLQNVFFKYILFVHNRQDYFFVKNNNIFLRERF